MLAYLFRKKDKPISAHVKAKQAEIKKEAVALVKAYEAALTANGFEQEASFWHKKYRFVLSTKSDRSAILRKQLSLVGYMSNEANKWTLLHTIVDTGSVGEGFIRFYGATTKQQQSVIALLMAAVVENKFVLWRMLAEKCWGPSAHFNAETKHWENTYHNFMLLIPFFLYHLMRSGEREHCDFLLKNHPKWRRLSSAAAVGVVDDNSSDDLDDDDKFDKIDASTSSSSAGAALHPFDVLSASDVQLMFMLACHDLDTSMMARLLTYAEEKPYSIFDEFNADDYKLRDFAGRALQIGGGKFSFHHTATEPHQHDADCATLFLAMSTDIPVYRGTALQVVLTRANHSHANRDGALDLLKQYHFPWHQALMAPYLLRDVLSQGYDDGLDLPLSELGYRLSRLTLVRGYAAESIPAIAAPKSSASSSSSTATTKVTDGLAASMQKLPGKKGVATNIFYELSLFMLNHAASITDPKAQIQPFHWAIASGADIHLWHAKVNDTVGTAWLLACFANLHWLVADCCNRLDDAQNPVMDYNPVLTANGKPIIEWLLSMVAAPEDDAIWKRLGKLRLAPEKAVLPSYYDGLITLFFDALARDKKIDSQDAQQATLLIRVVQQILPKHLTMLLAKNPNLQHKDDNNQHVMHVLASSSAVDAVEKFDLLNNHIAVNSPGWAWADELDAEQRSPLHLACEYARYSLIKKFLAHGKGVNFANNMMQLTPDGDTVLMLLANNPLLTDSQCAELMQTMLQIVAMPAQVNVANANGETCMHALVKHGRVQSLRQLLPLNPSLQQAGQAPLAPVVFYFDSQNVDQTIDELTLRKRKDASLDKMLPILQQMNFNVNEPCQDGDTVLQQVLKNKSPAQWTSNIESRLLQAGADVNALSADGKTARMCLEEGQATKDRRTVKALEPLRRALKDAGVDADAPGLDKSTAVHIFAASVTAHDIVPLRGNYNTPNQTNGQTPMHVLVANVRVSVTLLIAVFHRGGDPTLKDNMGRDAFAHADAAIKQLVVLTPQAKAQRNDAIFKLQECRNAWSEYHRKYIAPPPVTMASLAGTSVVALLPMPKNAAKTRTWADIFPENQDADGSDYGLDSSASKTSTKQTEKQSLLSADALDDGTKIGYGSVS